MRKDYSNIETILSMILLILFAICIFTLITTGNNTEKRIIEQTAIKANARAAESYINIAIKQNDSSGKIDVKQNPNTGENALVITDGSRDDKTNRWIYFDDNYLKESITADNMPPNDATATNIAKIDNFKITKEDQKIVSEISYIYNNEPHTVEQIYVLRSK